MKKVLPAKAQWIQDSVAKFDPDKNQVVTEKGDVIEYELMIVAVGLTLNWDKVLKSYIIQVLKNPWFKNSNFELNKYKCWKTTCVIMSTGWRAGGSSGKIRFAGLLNLLAWHSDESVWQNQTNKIRACHFHLSKFTGQMSWRAAKNCVPCWRVLEKSKTYKILIQFLQTPKLINFCTFSL